MTKKPDLRIKEFVTRLKPEMGIECKYRSIAPEEFNTSPSHPFGLDLVEDWDELISFYDDLRCLDRDQSKKRFVMLQD